MNILLVEDNENIVNGLEYAFSKNNYNLVSKMNIKSSIEYVLNNGKFQYSRLFNDSHLKQNKSIGKYLPDVFLEDSSFKENLRCFVHPFFMYQKIYKETVKLNFNYYNHVCKLKEKERDRRRPKRAKAT